MRSLSSPTAAAAANVYTQPGILVQISFNSAILRYSSRIDETWGGFTWGNNNMAMTQGQEQPNGTVTMTLTIGNSDRAFGAVRLNEAPQDKPVQIWQFFEGATASADPVPIFGGTIDSCAIAEAAVTLQLARTGSSTLVIPRLRIGSATGFNRLTPAGRVIAFNGQRYQILPSPSTGN